ncbi:hypothetical protein B4N89_02060 [Embleya scabrispora]|uniref:Uncharacterized protein n=1 Tax=Embleya scabrispora TaxID=159449 RepID=A0A1T3NSL9_9ACTN|nr:hypothetical protein [Embleya scabrispora]OPC79887.1 hypothetical protein B4N89_02060 [Embleya scabrispora]
MRIRATLVAVAGATVFAFAGAGTAQAHEGGVEVDHTTASGVLIAHGHGCHGGKLAAFHLSRTHVSIR